MPRSDELITSNGQEIGPLGDLSPVDLRDMLHRMADWVADYRANITDLPIAQAVVPGAIAGALDGVDWEEGTSFEVIVRDLDRIVMPGIVNWGNPSFLGYFGSTSNGPALLGEIAAAALNVSAMTWKTSPAATEMETVTVEWIRRMIGMDQSFSGVVYDTASISTLHALAAAREVAGPNIRMLGIGNQARGRLRIYVSDQTHSSVVKSAIMLGIGETNVVRIPTTADFTMDVPLLEAAIDSDVSNGFLPMAVVATVGTTSTASVDPVTQIAGICAARKIWLHVDAAYGAAMAVLPEGRWVMDGTDLADSIVVNPHKWLFVPLDFSVLFTRHPEILRSVFTLTPEYLSGDAASGGVIDYMDFGIQLGRRFRALKAWMTFRSFGRRGIENRIREHCRLAREFATLVEQESDFVLAAPPLMSIVCFRFQPSGFDETTLDRINENIAEAVNDGGKAYITHTMLRGRTALRVGVGNISTSSTHIVAAWETIVAVARRVIEGTPLLQ